MQQPAAQRPPQEGKRPAEAHIADANLLLALLAQERQALHTADHELLSRVCREKAQALTRFSGLLNVLKHPASANLLPDQRLQLQELLLRCLRENRDNNALLEARASRARRTLQALQGTPANYDGRGRGRYSFSGSVRGAA